MEEKAVIKGWLPNLSREYNGYHDSDFFDSYWDGEKVVEFMSGTTRGVMARPVMIEASPEEKALAAVWLKEEARRNWAKKMESAPDKGCVVRVVKGRKVPLGVEGEVFWAGSKSFDKYGRWPEWRVGLELGEGNRVFLAAKNVELIALPLRSAA